MVSSSWLTFLRFGFRVSSFGFEVSASGFWVSGFGFQFWVFGFGIDSPERGGHARHASGPTFEVDGLYVSAPHSSHLRERECVRECVRGREQESECV